MPIPSQGSPALVAQMGCVLHHGRGVPIPLEHDGLGLIVVEVDLVLQGTRVLGPRDLHGLCGHALELLELAVVELDTPYTLYLTHASDLAPLQLILNR
jgi:hypothetical protein